VDEGKQLKMRRYNGQGKEFGWCAALGKSLFLMIGNYGIGFLFHPGPQQRHFQIFRVTN
jgi:hypothetical protein